MVDKKVVLFGVFLFFLFMISSGNNGKQGFVEEFEGEMPEEGDMGEDSKGSVESEGVNIPEAPIVEEKPPVKNGAHANGAHANGAPANGAPAKGAHAKGAHAKGAPKMMMMGYEPDEIYSSPMAPNFGKLIELKQVAVLNDSWSKKDIENQMRKIKQPQPSQMGSFDSHFEVPKTMPGEKPEVQKMPAPTMETGSGPVEVHMVYADWCGHSKRALPAFDKLVENKSVKTKSGRDVVFVKTEEKSKGFKDFKVRGFPSYRVRDGGKIMPINAGDRSEKALIAAASELP